MALTPKQEKFCQCVVSGMSYKDSYMTAYDCKSSTTAINEGSKLALREDIQKRLETLTIPIQKAAQKQALSEREKKRQWLWSMIENATNDSDKLRAMDILNKMDSEYIDINRSLNTGNEEIKNLDTDKLIKLVKEA